MKNVSKIPNEFSLFGCTIKVVFDNHRTDLKNIYGEADLHANIIYLDNNRSENDVMQTFLHEVTHFCLKRLGYGELGDDERFVESFSRALHQCLTT